MYFPQEATRECAAPKQESKPKKKAIETPTAATQRNLRVTGRRGVS